MNKLALLAAVAVLGFAGSAAAAPVFKVQVVDRANGNATVTITDNMAGDLNAAAGQISVDLVVTGATIATHFATRTGPSETAGLTLTSTIVGSANVEIWLTGTGFSFPAPPLTVQDGFTVNRQGAASAQAVFTNYIDTTDAEFGTQNISFSQTMSATNVVQSAENVFVLNSGTTPFSLSLFQGITQSSGRVIYSTTQITEVPVPATLALLGAGLLGLGLRRRRA